MQLFTKNLGHCQSCQQRSWSWAFLRLSDFLLWDLQCLVHCRVVWQQEKHLPPCSWVPTASTYALPPWDCTCVWRSLTAESPAQEQPMVRWDGGCLGRLVVQEEGTKWWGKPCPGVADTCVQVVLWQCGTHGRSGHDLREGLSGGI